jgi:hypothetical protein
LRVFKIAHPFPWVGSLSPWSLRAFGLKLCSLVKPTNSSGYHFATPLPATPGETLGKSVNLIVVTTGKSQQLTMSMKRVAPSLRSTVPLPDTSSDRKSSTWDRRAQVHHGECPYAGAALELESPCAR